MSVQTGTSAGGRRRERRGPIRPGDRRVGRARFGRGLLGRPTRSQRPRSRTLRARPRSGSIRGPHPDLRRSYASADYVRFTAAAFEAWAEVADEAGEQLVSYTGGLDLFPQDPIDDPDDYIAAMGSEDVAHEVLDAGALMSRWPAWRIADNVTGIFQPDAGVVAASRANATHRRLALARGADLRAETLVLAITAETGGFALQTASRTFRSGSLVVAADAWTNEVLAPFGVDVPLRITQEQVTYFDAADAASFDPSSFPIWIWHRAPHMYGLPSFEGLGPKVAIHGGGPEVTPATRSFQPDPVYAAVVTGFVGEHLPGALGSPMEVRTCQYALTPDQDFVLDLVPELPHAAFGLGTGHAFKFASAFGRALVDLALDGTSPWRLPRFAADRPGLSGRT